jgi:hypothetical protein
MHACMCLRALDQKKKTNKTKKLYKRAIVQTINEMSCLRKRRSRKFQQASRSSSYVTIRLILALTALPHWYCVHAYRDM